MNQTFYANLFNDQLIVIQKLEKDVADLNRLLRDVGWGQGEIDTAAVVSEENEQLVAALRNLVEAAKEKEWDDEDGYWLDGSCSVCKNMLYRKHLKSCTYAAAITEAERLLGDAT